MVADRAGLVMDANSIVKYRGVEVGRVASIQPKDGATLYLEVQSSQLRYIPANVEAQISALMTSGGVIVGWIGHVEAALDRRQRTGCEQQRHRDVHVRAGILDLEE